MAAGGACDTDRGDIQAHIRQPDTSRSRRSDTDYRVILLGKTGVGKSATGNLLCNMNYFTSTQSSTSVTQDCQSVITLIEGKSVLVVDTPGLFDTDLDDKERVQKISECLDIGAPGFDAFLVVVSLKQKQASQDANVFQNIIDLFGEDMLAFTIVIFTHKKLLKASKIKIDEYIDQSPALKHFVSSCSDRYVAVENSTTSKTRARKARYGIFDMMISMKQNNNGRIFKTEVIKLAEIAMAGKMEEMIEDKVNQAIREHDKKMKREIEKKLRAEFQKSIAEFRSDNNSSICSLM